MALPLAQFGSQIGISDTVLYSIIAALLVMGVLLLLLLVLIVVAMRRISRLSKGLAATADEELRTKLLQQSSWWPRFRFRTMLVVFILLAVCVGMFAVELNRARRQANIVESLQRSGYNVSAHYRLGILGNGIVARLLGHWVHPDFGCEITCLSVQNPYTEDDPLNTLTDSDLAAIARLRSLDTLAVGRGVYTSDGFRELLKLPSLKRLLVGGGGELKDGVIEALAEFRQLELLELHRCGLTGTEVDSLAALDQLNALGMRQNPISLNGLKALSHLDSIESIEIDNYPVRTRVWNELPGHIRLLDSGTWLFDWRFIDNRPALMMGIYPGTGLGGGGAF